MKPPIFVYGTGSLDVFSTKARAESYMEAIDVNDGVYTALYDSEGYLLKVSVQPDNRLLIYTGDPLVKKPDELRERIVALLKAIRGIPHNWIAEASYDDLVAKALEYKTD